MEKQKKYTEIVMKFFSLRHHSILLGVHERRPKQVKVPLQSFTCGGDLIFRGENLSLAAVICWFTSRHCKSVIPLSDSSNRKT